MPTQIQKVLLTGKTHTTLARNYASQGGEERLDIRLLPPTTRTWSTRSRISSRIRRRNSFSPAPGPPATAARWKSSPSS